MDMNASMSKFLHCKTTGMFLLRLVTGLIFLMHGAMKLGNMDMTIGMMSHFGLFWPACWAWFIALLETLGGAAIIFGVATRLFGLLLGIEMIVAIFLTGIGRGFGPHELELLLAASSFTIAFVGGGCWSLHKGDCMRWGGIFCSGDQCVLEVADDEA